MTRYFWDNRRLDWMYPVAIVLGVSFLVFGTWLDFRDGTPTMNYGSQPLEVGITQGLGFLLLGNGISCSVYALRDRRRQAHPRSEQERGLDAGDGGESS